MKLLIEWLSLKFTFTVVIVAALILVGPHPAFATLRTVTSLDDSGPGSLRDTITASASGDTIDFAVAGTITLTTGPLSNEGKDISIIGPGPDSLPVTRSGDIFRIFHFGVNRSVYLSGLNITGGMALGEKNCVSEFCLGGGIKT